MAAQSSNSGSFFPSCIFSRIIDLADFKASSFSAKACTYTGFFSETGGLML
jgi:hypothetical protein